MKSTVAMISQVRSCFRQDFLIDFLRTHVLIEQFLLGGELDDFLRLSPLILAMSPMTSALPSLGRGQSWHPPSFLRRKFAALTAMIRLVPRTTSARAGEVAQRIELVGGQGLRVGFHHVITTGSSTG